MAHWKYIAVFALVVSVAAQADANHQGKGNEILKTPSGRPLIDRKNQSIEKKGPAEEPTEPARELPLDKEPILICDIKSKDRPWTIEFRKEKGYQSATIVDTERDIAELDCRPKETGSQQLKALECSMKSENGFFLSFTYPTGGVMHLGKFYEVNLGRRSSRPDNVICRN